MERATPVRKTHTSTADLLSWSDAPPPSGAPNASLPAPRSHPPSDGISKVVFGGQITDEEAESLNKRKPCSGYKLKDMTGSNIFADDGADGTPADSSPAYLNPNTRTSVRIVQQTGNAVSQISFGDKESVSPKKPTSLPEVAKQRELSGTLENEADGKNKKLLSDTKTKELSGHDIFGPPPEIPPRPVAASRTFESKESKDVDDSAPKNVRTSVKVSNPAGGQSNIQFGEEAVIKITKKIHNQKFADLTGNNIFQGDVTTGSPEKPLSNAKLKEMSGSNIFADGKAQSREYRGGVRQSPGGDSTISLV